MYDEVDGIVRRIISEKHKGTSFRNFSELLEIIDNITGGLGYTKEEPLDVVRMGLAGSVIAWPEVLRDGDKVLEIGTGLGRTAYVVHYAVKPSIYVTIDVSGEILFIALYKNPIKVYQDVLWRSDVKIIYADATRIIKCLNDVFDHIIHDGGPNPRRNKKLYSMNFLKALVKLLKPGGRLSIFIGSERLMQERIYTSLIEIGLRIIETKSLPFSKARVIHAVKP